MEEASETGGDGGGAAVAEATPEATGGTPDVYGGTLSSEPAASPESSPAPQTGDIISRIYTAEGGLAENYTDVLREAGLDNLANTVAKYKSADGLLKGAANLISFAGKKVEGVVVPDMGASEEEVAAYRQAIGVPESPTAYDIQPENMPEGLEWNDEVAGFWQGKFHELGIPQQQAEAIAQAYSDHIGQQLESAKETLSANEATQMEQQRAQMQKAWGRDYNANMEKAVNMAAVQGFDFDNPNDLAAVRNPKVLEMLLAKNSSLQEGTLPRGGEGNPHSKSLRDQARDLYTQSRSEYGSMDLAPSHVRSKYLELQKLASRHGQ